MKPEENDLPIDPVLEAFWKRVLFWSEVMVGASLAILLLK